MENHGAEGRSVAIQCFGDSGNILKVLAATPVHQAARLRTRGELLVPEVHGLQDVPPLMRKDRFVCRLGVDNAIRSLR